MSYETVSKPCSYRLYLILIRLQLADGTLDLRQDVALFDRLHHGIVVGIEGPVFFQVNDDLIK
jgi:hypothetical protein